MRKNVLILVASVLLLTSCGTYTGEGAATGGYFGSLIGSMIGGISDGRRGSDIGGLIGMAGGAVVGAIIGNAADEQVAREREEYIRNREMRRARINQRTQGRGEVDDFTPDEPDEPYAPEGYFDPTNSGDDRIEFDNDTTAVVPAPPADFHPQPSNFNEGLVIRNALFRDADGNQILVAGEECTVTFEILNRTHRPLYDVQPIVYDVLGNKHIHISQNLRVERILPGRGIRYTATIKADRHLRNGQTRIRVGVALNNEELQSQTHEFVIETRKR